MPTTLAKYNDNKNPVYQLSPAHASIFSPKLNNSETVSIILQHLTGQEERTLSPLIRWESKDQLSLHFCLKIPLKNHLLPSSPFPGGFWLLNTFHSLPLHNGKLMTQQLDSCTATEQQQEGWCPFRIQSSQQYLSLYIMLYSFERDKATQDCGYGERGHQGLLWWLTPTSSFPEILDQMRVNSNQMEDIREGWRGQDGPGLQHSLSTVHRTQQTLVQMLTSHTVLRFSSHLPFTGLAQLLSSSPSEEPFPAHTHSLLIQEHFSKLYVSGLLQVIEIPLRIAEVTNEAVT